jgi:hypothetical protein
MDIFQITQSVVMLTLSLILLVTTVAAAAAAAAATATATATAAIAAGSWYRKNSTRSIFSIASADPSRNSTVRFGSGSGEVRIPFRLLLVGDSVDRYAIWDWCESIGGRLLKDDTIFPYFVPLHRSRFPPKKAKPRNSSPTCQPTPTISQYQDIIDKHKDFHSRRYSLEPTLCDARSIRGIVVGLVANKMGTKMNPPWHMPVNIVAGPQSTNFENMRSLNATFQAILTPGFNVVEELMGGPPHAILVNSLFWDLAHPDLSGNREGNPSLWIDTWLENVQLLMSIIKSRYSITNTSSNAIERNLRCVSEFQSSDMWMGFRTANYFQAVDNDKSSSSWYTPYSYMLMIEMNERARRALVLPAKAHVDILDAYVPKMPLRDFMHPATTWSAKILDAALEFALLRLNLTDC